MSSLIRLWTCAAFLPVYRCGGWASLRVSPGQVTGLAGGERHTTAVRCALAGLAAALRDLPAGAGAIEIRAASPELAPFAAIIAGLAAQAAPPAPEEDLDLWAQILATSAGRRLTLVRAPVDPATPSAFVAAWAELARDKAKASGPFSAAIPKPNLAKIAGLAAR